MNRSVFKKIADLEQAQSTELSEVKIDLALIDDLANMTKNAKTIASEFMKNIDIADQLTSAISEKQKQLDSQKKLIQKDYVTADKFQTAESKLYAKLQKAADDLGMALKDIKGWNEYYDASISVNNAINQSSKYMM